VPVDELAQPLVVVDRGVAAPPADEELEAGQAERVLDIDADEAHRRVVLARRPQVVLGHPALRIRGGGLVGDRPDLGHALGPVVRRQRQAGHQATSSSRGLARYRRPTFADGRPSVMTTSPVKSFSPRISDEPTPYESTGTPACSKARIFSTVKPP